MRGEAQALAWTRVRGRLAMRATRRSALGACVIAGSSALLTGCTFDEASEHPRSGQLLSSPEVESAFIVSVSDTLQESLA
ncbi:hypothetical protein [Streptomyces sp. BE133]|uniref:hypothetical protein n=1 Tax=Streptomyces sp. BE133 TaxID=3002523 RepID=UPI002E75A9F6|nr:hypothetical protein [Streptomyces sp. BE133]MEE1806151.1 hypothetical protein [Streptomyces sp. BE133]